jgi:hypothetical protein
VSVDFQPHFKGKGCAEDRPLPETGSTKFNMAVL